MTELWLVRHGQTDWNLGNIVQGQQDIPLNETGIAQARQLAETLAVTRFDAIYASDLIRARLTAQILAERLGLTVTLDPRLREIRQGVWEGHAISEILELYPEDFRGKNDDPTRPAAEGAEPASQVVTRMVQAANDLHARHKEQRLILVTHGFAIAALYCTAMDIPLSEVGRHIPENGTPVVLKLEKALELPVY